MPGFDVESRTENSRRQKFGSSNLEKRRNIEREENLCPQIEVNSWVIIASSRELDRQYTNKHTNLNAVFRKFFPKNGPGTLKTYFLIDKRKFGGLKKILQVSKEFSDPALG